jgi:hypothetical protein
MWLDLGKAKRGGSREDDGAVLESTQALSGNFYTDGAGRFLKPDILGRALSNEAGMLPDAGQHFKAVVNSAVIHVTTLSGNRTSWDGR